MIINVQNLTAAFTAFSARFAAAFGGVTPSWTEFASPIPSNTEQNLYAWLGQFPELREWLGDRIIKNMVASDYTLVNKDFESTVGIDRNKFNDDVFGIFGTLFADMGLSAANHPDKILYDLLLLGASELGYDGQFFFDTDHEVIVDGVATTVSNYDATGAGDMWVVMDTTRPLKPMILQQREPYTFQSFTQPTDETVFMKRKFIYGVDARAAPGFGLWQMAYASLNTLNATNFNAASTAMRSIDGDEGHPLGIVPNLIIVGQSNRVAARALFGVDTLASGAGNPNFNEVKVLVSPRMP